MNEVPSVDGVFPAVTMDPAKRTDYRGFPRPPVGGPIVGLNVVCPPNLFHFDRLFPTISTAAVKRATANQASPRVFKLTLAYDGGAYAGWQVQPGEKTHQQTLEDAVEAVTGQQTRTLASGRTDSGVHAYGQVVRLRVETRLDSKTLKRALNANLPRDMVVREVEESDSNFHPIRDSIRKRYRYVLYDGCDREIFRRHYCWQVRYRLDVEAMHEAAQVLMGRHDFSSFETTGAPRPDSIRTVTDIFVRREEREEREDREEPEDRREREETSGGDFITMEIEADGFLYNMVRSIVGTLVEIGRGNEQLPWIRQVLEAKDRKKAGPTAPPQGLFLVRVDYE